MKSDAVGNVLYGHHEADYERYGEWFARHMDRMTVEQLDGKAEIAWELAYRDQQLEVLRDFIGRLGRTIYEAEKHIDPSILYPYREV